jgi:hypothetical protein
MNAAPNAARSIPLPPRVCSLCSACLALWVLFVSPGCQSYQLGDPAPTPFETIYIAPVANESFAPQAQAILSTQLREVFLRDGRTRLVMSEEDADAALYVTLKEYTRRAAARRSDDTVRAQGFDIGLHAMITLYDFRNEELLFNARPIQANTNALVTNPYRDDSAAPTQSFLQSEQQAMPRLTRDLARQIADEVLSPWPDSAAAE